jgi:hypothetical protein
MVTIAREYFVSGILTAKIDYLNPLRNVVVFFSFSLSFFVSGQPCIRGQMTGP